VLALN